MSSRHEEPLLRPTRMSSEQSEDRHIEEEDALLTGQQQNKYSQKPSWPFWRQAGLFAWATLATALAIILAVLYQKQETSHQSGPGNGFLDYSPPSGKRNLIFMVSDGMGPTSLSLTRSFLQTEKGLPFDHELLLDSHQIGSSRTRSTSSLITDSAAGATAFSCGQKSYNGAISILPNQKPCGTVMEAAKKAGYTTGLVVTTRITDATPACFAAHVTTRSEEDMIAEQEVGSAHPLGRVVDLILGGGRCHFLSNSTQGSCRNDNTDVVDIAEKNEWTYLSNRTEFDGLKSGSEAKLPLLGLFAELDIPYEIDRAQQNDVYPSLSEMAETALNALAAATQNSEQGFFIMIEGSRIDHAGHGNDPVAQVHEVLEYDKTFAKVLDFVKKSTSVPTVVVSTSDHETGGLATARQLHESYPEYLWYPGVLANASHSASFLADELREHIGTHVAAGNDAQKTWIRSQLLEPGLGIQDATDDEVQQLIDSTTSDTMPTSYVLADMISRRAQTGWSTHGHSAADVNIYASDPAAARPLIGNHENTEVGDFLARYLDVDLAAITDELRSKGEAKWPGGTWLGGALSTDDSEAGLESYTGDHKHRVKRGQHNCASCHGYGEHSHAF